jgi:pimeloyl-ACP methyl ester carboxylesterase
MFANLAAQLELDPEMEPVSTADVGSFTWDFYAFERQGYPADLALAEEDGKTYFVFLLSPVDEHESLYKELFLPAVEAMTPVSETSEPADTKEPAGSQAKYGENFEVASCPFGLPPGQVDGETVECGYLTVPENRNDPDSREIRLAVAIFHPPEGTQPSEVSPKADPLIFLEGGPGGSALKIRVPTFDAFFVPMFAANRDIVVFDQRGTGFSEPALECPGYTELYLDLLDLEVGGQQLNSQEILERKVETFQACAEELSQVADLSAYHTAANAADVNDLRLALRYDQVNLWGGSYGTRLALEVMRAYPEGVRSAILDAPYPPEVDAYVDTPGSYARALSVLVERCASDEACNAAFPELRDTLFETVDRLNESPASLEVVHPLTGEHYARRLDGDGLLELVFRSLYDTALLPQLPQAIYDASEGTFTAFQRTMAIDILRQYIRNWGMYFSVLCHDEIPFSTWQEFKAAVAEHPEFAGFFGGFEVGGLSYQVCPGWGAGQAEINADEPVGNDIPAIVLTGEYDPIIPPNWGEQIAETLPGSHFFQFSGMGHGVLGADCPRSLVFAFLDDPVLAPDDACVAEMEITPFTVPMEAADVELKPYASEVKSIGGVAPAGWTETNPGVLVRGSTALDQTILVLDVQPLDAETVLSLIVQQFGLDKAPQSQGEREANGLTWALHTAETQGYVIGSALAERGEATLVVLLVTAASERDVLHGAVFLPVVDALVPLD